MRLQILSTVFYLRTQLCKCVFEYNYRYKNSHSYIPNITLSAYVFTYVIVVLKCDLMTQSMSI